MHVLPNVFKPLIGLGENKNLIMRRTIPRHLWRQNHCDKPVRVSRVFSRPGSVKSSIPNKKKKNSTLILTAGRVIEWPHHWAWVRSKKVQGIHFSRSAGHTLLWSTTFVTHITFLVKLEILLDVAFTLIQTPFKWFSCVFVEFVVFHSPVTCQESWALSDSSSSCVDARLSVRFLTCLSYTKKIDVLKYLIKLMVVASVVQKVDSAR